jgi:hypothetical protein
MQGWNRLINQSQMNGIESTAEETLAETIEIETHLHDREKWLGLAAVPNGEIHRADRVGGATQPFQLTAGNNDFGQWVQILGSGDTPVEAGKTFFDAHRYLVSNTNSTDAYIIQLAAGESADLAAKIAAEQFTEVMYISESNNNDSGIEEVMSIRVPTGQKIWARCACIGSNGSLLDFYYGIHEYDV